MRRIADPIDGGAKPPHIFTPMVYRTTYMIANHMRRVQFSLGVLYPRGVSDNMHGFEPCESSSNLDVGVQMWCNGNTTHCGCVKSGSTPDFCLCADSLVVECRPSKSVAWVQFPFGAFTLVAQRTRAPDF